METLPDLCKYIAMAEYLYKCPECGQFKEITRSIHDPEEAPSCCNQDMKKQFHSPTVNLVGRGFYRNGG